MILKNLYHISLRIFHLLLLLVKPFNQKAALFCKGREGLLRKISESVNPGNPVAWFHCASVGEFEQARPLIERYRELNPGHRILLTFFSPSGYELRKNWPLADWVFYLPLDIKRNAVKFLDAVNPRVAIFIKYEYWFNYLFELKKRRIPSYVASAIFRPDQRFFKWYGSIFRRMLRTFSHIFVQNSESAELLRGIGIKCVTVAGDTRFDRVAALASESLDIELIKHFCSKSRCWVAGSTWGPDEELISAVIQSLPQNKLIIAPHEVGENHIEKIISKFQENRILRYSFIKDKDLSSGIVQQIEESDILLIDTVGILSSLYKYGSFAYIGGGFGAGIHNILEAAVYGIPVIFGPGYQKFMEATDLIKLGGAVSVNDSDSLKQALKTFLSDPEKCQSAGKVCREYVENGKGASEKVCKTIQRWLQ
ncbi:MAG: glycosyltransferase N-terminal domain-containing protein [Bacteroidales bacterium]|nr:3-deoxy-D-manno-octulosonic acid transferase [Bacteroidales bacterium]MDD2425230.1 glycosyltransferase N-terminal domain-containing protein [Bacteroidales bacterium]MDD3989939.1 glycosyltransferase N-terminal domain-containing protein [Bacteroidales bacterium]MDD4638824.1 glycosyltransferase N-terminal domain-containing protein [Bacteroidales bacterium]